MAYTSDDQKPCARGDRCAERTNGQPALGPRAFCATDHQIVGRALTWLPAAYVDLHQRLGERTTSRTERVSSSRTPAVPINLAVDSLLTDMVGLLESWAERVRHVARLSERSTEKSRHRRDAVVVVTAVQTLTAHLDVLLALPAEPMPRFLQLRDAAALADGVTGIVRAYDVIANPELSGADAGLEILHLHARARSMLGLTPRHEDLPVPCWSCGLKAVRRWDGSAGLADEAECSGCGETYTHDRYTLLIRQVAELQRSKGTRQASA